MAAGKQPLFGFVFFDEKNQIENPRQMTNALRLETQKIRITI